MGPKTMVINGVIRWGALIHGPKYMGNWGLTPFTTGKGSSCWYNDIFPSTEHVPGGHVSSPGGAPQLQLSFCHVVCLYTDSRKNRLSHIQQVTEIHIHSIAGILLWEAVDFDGNYFRPNLSKQSIVFSHLGPCELRKKPSYFPLYWLVYRDPYISYIGLLKFPYNWVGFHPRNTT